MDLEQVGVRVTGEEKMAWQSAAERLGITLSDLVRESVRAYLGKTRLAWETLEKIQNEVEEEYAPKLKSLEEELAAAKERVDNFSSYLRRLEATILELERKADAESDPEAFGKLIDEIGRLRAVREQTLPKAEQATKRVNELEKAQKELLKEKEKAYKTALQKAFPSVAEPLLERLALDVCEVTEALSPFLAAHERATLYEMLSWLRIRTAMVAKEKSANAWLFLGKPQPLYYQENYSTWEGFWSNLWRRFAV